jgi:GMP synthase (glutamine-hydrolysing)
MVNILCVTHADFETPGTIGQWALEKGHGFTIVRPYRGDELPDMGRFDALIVMGGPQSPLRTVEFPYLSAEIALIKAALVENKKVLGFCLGAQLIGEALGGKTAPSPEKETGVYAITLTSAAADDALLKGLPSTFPVIHWHNDMPGLTENAVVLASSPGCPRQIVRYKDNAYGFQCHMEIDRDGIEALIESKFTQSRRDLLDNDYASINSLMATILDRFAALRA